MAKEDIFVEEAMAAAEKILPPPLLIRRHAPLLYEVTVIEVTRSYQALFRKTVSLGQRFVEFVM